MLYTCQICPNSFEASPAAKRKFCSRACYNQGQNTKVERTCENCKATFYVSPYKVKEGKGRYCSRACADTGWDEPCENCGKLVHRTPHHAKTQEHVFCSRKCYHVWTSQKVERACRQCGKIFRDKPSQMTNGRGKYCSQACYDEARRQQMVTFVCEICGNQFTRPHFWTTGQTHYRGKYCSSKCKSIGRQLPDSARSVYDHQFTDYLKIQIRQRDNFTCQLCQKAEAENGRALDCHHIDYDKTNCHPSNLISLCRFCHSRTNYNRAYWQNYFTELMLIKPKPH